MATPPQPVGLAFRLYAFLLDATLVSVLGKIVFLALRLDDSFVPGKLVPSFDSLSSIVALAILWFYNVLLVKYYGATVGKMALGLQVVKADGGPLDWFTAILRETVGKMISAIPAGFGFFWVAWDAKKQGFHDKIADTLVIKL